MKLCTVIVHLTYVTLKFEKHTANSLKKFRNIRGFYVFKKPGKISVRVVKRKQDAIFFTCHWDLTTSNFGNQSYNNIY